MPASSAADHPFSRYDLRTTDPDAARRFYVDVVGLAFDEGGALGVWQLHEQARARGAPAHWLGQIAVDDVVRTAEQMQQAGSQPLGPTAARGREDEAFAVFRDVGEAVVGLREIRRRPTSWPVAWHQLHTRDLERSWSLYTQLFGWRRGASRELGAPPLEHRSFRWASDGPDVGSMADTALRPGIHPHWLFYFPVADLERTLADVRARGGIVAASFSLPNGDLCAACDDPQGAAFGLVQDIACSV